jgi:hypothetical protein
MDSSPTPDGRFKPHADGAPGPSLLGTGEDGRRPAPDGRFKPHAEGAPGPSQLGTGESGVHHGRPIHLRSILTTQ